MISRVAEHCFWLGRYVERAENTSRTLQVNADFLLDVSQPELERWRPILIVAGEEERFIARHGVRAADSGDQVQDYLVWDDTSPVSLMTSFREAREIARTIRETISLEAWTVLNDQWLWLRRGPGRRLFGRDRHQFYERVKDSCHLFHGVCHDTMPHTEPYDFMQLGMQLERAGQTARILDIKYHKLGPTTDAVETPEEAAQWLATLRSCSATEPFFKKGGAAPTGPAVAEFLLFDPDFPRTIMFALTRAWHFLQRIRPRDGAIGVASARQLERVLRRLRGGSIERVLERGIHRELTWVVDMTAAVCDAVRADYFAVTPTPDPAAS